MNRLLDVILLLERANASGCFSEFGDNAVDDILTAGIETLWGKLADKSEWMACRLHAL